MVDQNQHGGRNCQYWQIFWPRVLWFCGSRVPDAVQIGRESSRLADSRRRTRQHRLAAVVPLLPSNQKAFQKLRQWGSELAPDENNQHPFHNSVPRSSNRWANNVQMPSRVPDWPMSLMGQTEKNSVRAYVFRFTLKLGHRSMQSPCLKRAKLRHKLPGGTGDLKGERKTPLEEDRSSGRG